MCIGPKKAWGARNAALYTPTFRINRSLPVTVEFGAKVMEDIRLWPDRKLGSFLVRFPAGSTRGQVRTENNAVARSRGFPAVTRNTFWLVATKKGRIRGNTGRGDNGHAKVYIEARSGGASRGGGYVAYVLASAGRGRPLQSSRKTVRTQRV